MTRLDGLVGRRRDRERIAGALQAVTLDAAVELGGVVGCRGLVVDDDEAVAVAVQQVDVALEQPSIDGRARVHLSPVGAARGLDDRR